MPLDKKIMDPWYFLSDQEENKKSMKIKDIERIILDRFSPKYKYNNPEDLEVAKVILNSYQELANSKKQRCYGAMLDDGTLKSIAYTTIKGQDNYAIGLETHISGCPWMFGPVFNDRTLTLLFAYINPKGISYSDDDKLFFAPFKSKEDYLLKKWGENQIPKNFYNDLKKMSDFGIQYAFQEHFVSTPEVKGLSFGKVDGGHYILECVESKEYGLQNEINAEKLEGLKAIYANVVNSLEKVRK
jgi:hypothetical protein